MGARQALGRGLEALIPPSREEEGRGVLEVPVAAIRPSPLQPRKHFDAKAIQELAQSIRTHGVLSPVILREAGDRFELVAGERRLRAARLAGLERIPAVIREVGMSAMLEMALIENIQRADLNPIEEAEVYNRLIQEFGLTQEEVAARVGRERSSVANTLRLLRLHPTLHQALIEGRLSAGQARPLLSLEGREQVRAGEQVIRRALSARAVEVLVKRLRGQDGIRKVKAKPASPQLRALEEGLRRALATKVRIVRSGRRGRIEIDFYSDDDLTRLVDLIRRRR
ncbi:MAG: ParB/RepB/Spo0J family partition protein [Candidatus Methylomirabilales bacterium]